MAVARASTALEAPSLRLRAAPTLVGNSTAVLSRDEPSQYFVYID